MQEKKIKEGGVTLPTRTVDESKTVEERLTDNAIENILPARYLDKDMDGNVTESPEELFERVAANVAEAEYQFADDTYVESEYEYWSSRFKHMMKTQKFMPNSPTLMNAGLELQQLSACFVLEPQDDMEDILERQKEAGLVFKSGGGVGYTFSNLRPKGARVESTKGTSSGPVSFMRMFDEVCNQVKQGGKRRGAQMGIMRVDHPDIGRFITAKRTEGELSNFNISVAITDEFRRIVEEEDELYAYNLNSPQDNFNSTYGETAETYQFYHPDHQDGESIWNYADDIICTNGETLRERWEVLDSLSWDAYLNDVMQLPAQFVWDILVDSAWRNGEPGLFYLDEANREHTFDVDEYPEYEMHATNPCAEQPLCDHEACNLGHINLSLFKNSGAPTYDEFDGTISEYFDVAIDTAALNTTIRTGVRFLDNVAIMSDFPLEDIEDTVSNLRKIGLGVMGWAHLLYQMNIEYGSEESLLLGRRLMAHIDKVATESSHQLSHERGCFPEWEKSKYANPTEYEEWFWAHAHKNPEEWEDGYEMRNHNVTTVAPTGTTSMIADTSGGIEPVYNVAYRKHVGSDIGQLVEFDSYFEETLEANGIDVEDTKAEAAALMEAGAYDGPHDLSEVPNELADVFVTTNDVSTDGHVLMQRMFQSWVDSGISKTINLPGDATREDVSNAYTDALTKKMSGSPSKGLTVYRDQSRQDQVMTTQKHSEQDVEEAIEILETSGYEVVDQQT